MDKHQEISLVQLYKALILILSVIFAALTIYMFTKVGMTDERFWGPFFLTILSFIGAKFMHKVEGDVKNKMESS